MNVQVHNGYTFINLYFQNDFSFFIHSFLQRRYTYSPPGRSMSEKELKPEPLLARSKRQFRERSGSIPNEATFDRTILAEDKRPQQYSVCGAPSSDFFHGQGMRRKGKSWKDILKLKRKRAAKLHSPPPTADKASHLKAIVTR